MRPAVYLNGKFTAQRTTGVQRVAAALVQALDACPEAEGMVLLCPPGGRPPPLRRVRVAFVGRAGLPLHAWEQLVLPWVARSGLLVSLAGAAPALAARHVVLLHDAAVFDHPEAYRPAFLRWYRWLFGRLARRAAAVLTVSEFSRRRLALALGEAAARATVLHPGADHLDQVAPDDAVLDRLQLRGRPFLLAVGSANPTKNLDALVQAHARLGEQAPLLVLVGGRNDRVFAGARHVASAGLVAAGAVDDPALVALYRAAVALVFPSRYEGHGLPPLEAMRQGCPVLAARIPAVEEACGRAAAYLEGTGADAIEAALRRLLADSPGRQALRDAGRAHAAARRWTDAAAVLLRTLQPLCRS